MIPGVWLWMGVGLAGAAVPQQAPQSRRATLFLDFGGGSVGAGQGIDAASCVTSEFIYPIFLGSERASEIALAEAQRLLAPYGVRVVAERPPPSLRFARVRVGGEPRTLGLDSQLNGLSCVIDCDDQNHSDNVFMFADKWIDRVVLAELDEEQLALQIARIAVHEAAHSWGLEHTGGAESIMARFPSTVEPRFTQGCQSLDLDRDAECPEAHLRQCDADQQDAHAELLALFGEGTPDTIAPLATIVWPPEGLVVEPGATLEIELEIDDDYPGFGWMLEVPELGWEYIPDDLEQREISLVIPQGRFTLRLEAVDHDRNVGEAVVHIEAREPEEEPELPLEPRAECACRETQRGDPGPWAWLLLLGASVRRRARAIVRRPCRPCRP